METSTSFEDCRWLMSRACSTRARKIETVLIKNYELRHKWEANRRSYRWAVIANAVFDLTGVRLYRLPMSQRDANVTPLSLLSARHPDRGPVLLHRNRIGRLPLRLELDQRERVAGH